MTICLPRTKGILRTCSTRLSPHRLEPDAFIASGVYRPPKERGPFSRRPCVVTRSKMKRGNLVSPAMLVLVSLLLSSLVRVEGTIGIVKNGKSYHSKPDHKVGKTMTKGTTYMAHLQYIATNMHMCPNDGPNPRKWNITRPTDNLPGKIDQNSEKKVFVVPDVWVCQAATTRWAYVLPMLIPVSSPTSPLMLQSLWWYGRVDAP